MRTITQSTTLIVALLFCSNSLALSFNVEMDQATLQQRLASAFPVQQDDAFVSVQLAKPQVILKEGSDRIGIKTMATVFLPGGNKFAGITAVDGKLRYVAKNNALYLDQARLHELSIDGLPDVARQEVRRIASLLMRSFFDKQPIYIFKEDRSAALISKKISRVEVKNGKLVVEVSAF